MEWDGSHKTNLNTLFAGLATSLLEKRPVSFSRTNVGSASGEDPRGGFRF